MSLKEMGVKKVIAKAQGYVHQILMPSLVKRGSCQKL